MEFCHECSSSLRDITVSLEVKSRGCGMFKFKIYNERAEDHIYELQFVVSWNYEDMQKENIQVF